MASDVLSLSLSSVTPPRAPTAPSPLTLRPVSPEDREGLARSYLAAYPPGVGAAGLDQARAEIDETLAGEYGLLREDASAVVCERRRVLGAVLVAEGSIWDGWLAGPFIIDLFVSPQARGIGAGRLLLEHAVRACRAAGDERVSLRIGEGTSPAALRLYQGLGFTPLLQGSCGA